MSQQEIINWVGGLLMNKTLKMILDKYGAEVVIARILEQLRLLAETQDEEVIETVKEAVEGYCDTEYIYNLCEFPGVTTYASEIINISDDIWVDKGLRKNLFFY